jgi:uncharacterized membrane protein YgdD (TMEM256/DUF423 family)
VKVVQRMNWTTAGSAWGAVGVLLGAFGAHALQGRVPEADLEIWRTGVLYHLVHALALVLYGLFRAQRPAHSAPGWALLLGSIVFSGTLYGIVLGGPRALGALTPLGGISMVAGWIGFALQARRPPRGDG